MNAQFQISQIPKPSTNSIPNSSSDDSISSDSTFTENTVSNNPVYIKSPDSGLNMLNFADSSSTLNKHNSTTKNIPHTNDNNKIEQEINTLKESSDSDNKSEINNNSSQVLELPTVALDNFKTLINHYKYVDKTICGLRLFKGIEKDFQVQKKAKQTYMGRFARFFRDSQWGKTSLLSMLECIAGGEKNKELFNGLEISKPEYDYNWETYPVIRIAFGELPEETIEEFNKGLALHLQLQIEKHSALLGQETFQTITNTEGPIGKLKIMFNRLKNLNVCNKMVILFDEIDVPFTDDIVQIQPDTTEKDKQIIKKLIKAMSGTFRKMFSVLKAYQSQIKLLVVCGIVRDSIVGLSNSMSFVDEITFQEPFAHITGFTEKEIRKYFCEDVEQLALSLNGDQLRKYYETRKEQPQFESLFSCEETREEKERIDRLQINNNITDIREEFG